MDFLNKIASAWEKGSEVVLKDDAGNDIPLQKGIKYVTNKANKYEESLKGKINTKFKTTEEQVSK